MDKKEEQYWKGMKSELREIQAFIDSTHVLSTIFDEEFFHKLEINLQEYQKNPLKNRLHPLYNLLMKFDVGENFTKLKLLENDLGIIFSHPDIRKKDKNNTIGQLTSFDQKQSLDTLYEVNVQAHLIKQIGSRVELHKKTIGSKNPDAKITLDNRPVYIDITTLGDSKYTSDLIAERRQKSLGGKRNQGFPKIEYDQRRQKERLEEKMSQFSPGEPSVIFHFALGTLLPLPSEFIINNLNNIGLVMFFDRIKLYETTEFGCDPDCVLTKKEKTILENLFNTETYEAPLFRV